jgi:uncharacterized iron-regulated membrane protein
MDLRKLILLLHRWVGIVAALALLAIAVSASLLIFERPLNRLLNTSLVKVAPADARLPLNEIAGRLAQSFPQYRVAGWTLPQAPDEAVAVFLELNPSAQPSASAVEAIEVAVNPYTGAIMGDLAKVNPLMARINQFHRRFLAGKTGSAIVGWSAVCLLFLNLTGIILWWRRKIGRFHWSSSGTSFYFNVHQAVGIYAWAFLMLLSLTGIAMHWEREAGRLVDRLTGSPAPAKMLPADSVAQGASPVDSDGLVSIAEKSAPGAKVTRIQLASGPGNPVRVIIKYPEDHTPAGRTQVYLDEYSGKVRLLTDARSAPLGFKLMRLWNRQYHTGDIFGWPTQTLALGFSLALVVMAITGPMIWYKRKRATQSARVATANN